LLQSLNKHHSPIPSHPIMEGVSYQKDRDDGEHSVTRVARMLFPTTLIKNQDHINDVKWQSQGAQACHNLDFKSRQAIFGK
jgi:hypothetical protein